jgi:DNA repair protein RecO
MSHHVYNTRGLVLSVYPSKEADRVTAVLTPDLGLVLGTARGARKIDSKLVSALVELALVKVSLVRGKHSWRITTVTLMRNLATELRDRRHALEALSRVVSLLRQLVRGEEKHPELFDYLEKSLHLLIHDVDDEDLDTWELLTVANILSQLGYLSKDSLPSTLLETREKRRALLTLVNERIRSSGLYNI